MASFGVLPRKIEILQDLRTAPLMYHLWPLMTYSSPSRSMVELMFVASEDATPGSVIAKQDRISWLSKGSSHSCFCSSLPNFASTSMLPVSGAEQFIAKLA